MLDTLYTGCTIGAYSCLIAGHYTVSAIAKTDCILLKLSYSKILAMREKYDRFDKKVFSAEVYIEENGLPY